MRVEELKTGFFGYRKDGVYKLVASMEENFSSRLMEKDAQNAKALQDAQNRIAELESELRTLREESQANRKNQEVISQTLLDAQSYAQKLREETAGEERRRRTRLREEAQRQSERLEAYAGQVGQLRGVIQSLLRDMDERSRKTEEQIAALAAQAPEPEANLTLFMKKTGTEE